MSSWTIGTALAYAKQQLRITSDSPSLDAQLILAHLLGVDRAHIIAHPEKPLSDGVVAEYIALIQRRTDGEPYAYLVGHRAFYGRDFIVTPAVLVPRPETEHLVEHAITVMAREYADPSSLRVVDVGTGSGIIAISVALHFPQAIVYATDISPEALAVAERNAQLHAVNNVRFLAGDWLDPLIADQLKVNVILANPPYIPSGILPSLAVSKCEPKIALDGGQDGLVYYRRLFEHVRHVGTMPVHIGLEVGSGQSQAVINIARQHVEVITQQVIYDYAGHDRVVYMCVT